MMPSDRLLIADIGPAHGIKGAVKLRLFLDNPDLLSTLNPLFIGENGDKTTKLTLMQDAGKSGWIGRIDGVADRTTAEKWRGVKLYATRAALPNLDHDNDTDDASGDLGSYYITDLIDLTAVDADTNAAIGTVLSVDNFGASDLLDIKPTGGGATFYVPFTDDYVRAVDLAAGTIALVNADLFSGPAVQDDGHDDHNQDTTEKQ